MSHRRTTVLIGALLATSGCIVVPSSNYEGLSKGGINDIETRAQAIDVLRQPDLEAGRGRFMFYDLDGETEWNLWVWGMPAESSGETTPSRFRVLMELDQINRVTNTHTIKCGEGDTDPACNGDLPAAMWAMIATAIGDEAAADMQSVRPVSEEQNRAWRRAVNHGDIDTMQALLADGVNPRVEFDDGSTAIHKAAMFGNIDTISFLLANGVDADMQDREGKTPLMIAASNGKADTVRVLLQSSTIDARSVTGTTALNYAAQAGHGAVVDLLLERGANIRIEDAWEVAAFYSAAMNGHEDVAITLLNAGARPNKSPKNKTAPISQAVAHDNIRLMEALLDAGADPDDRGFFWNGETPLVIAAAGSSREVVQLLIDRGASVDKKGGIHPPLMTAVLYDNHPAAVALLEAGANPNNRSGAMFGRMSPTEQAQEDGNEALVELLVSFGGRF